LKKSEANNSAFEARISKFINSSSMRSKRKQEWSEKRKYLMAKTKEVFSESSDMERNDCEANQSQSIEEDEENDNYTEV
jgi:hypothetical protein